MYKKNIYKNLTFVNYSTKYFSYGIWIYLLNKKPSWANYGISLKLNDWEPQLTRQLLLVKVEMIVDNVSHSLCISSWSRATAIDVVSHLGQLVCYSVRYVGTR